MNMVFKVKGKVNIYFQSQMQLEGIILTHKKLLKQENVRFYIAIQRACVQMLK